MNNAESAKRETDIKRQRRDWERQLKYPCGYLGLFLVLHFEKQQLGVIGYTTSTHSDTPALATMFSKGPGTWKIPLQDI